MKEVQERMELPFLPLSRQSSLELDSKFFEAESSITKYLIVSNKHTLKDRKVLLQLRVTHIINLSGEGARTIQDVEQIHGKDIGLKKVLRLDFRDHSSVDISAAFDRCFSIVEEARTEGGVCLMYCAAGVSRSIAVTLAYLVSVTKMSLIDAFRLVRFQRPSASPNIGFMKCLLKLEMETSGKVTLNIHRYIADQYGRVDDFCINMKGEGEEIHSRGSSVALSTYNSRSYFPSRSPSPARRKSSRSRSPSTGRTKLDSISRTKATDLSSRSPRSPRRRDRQLDRDPDPSMLKLSLEDSAVSNRNFFGSGKDLGSVSDAERDDAEESGEWFYASHTNEYTYREPSGAKAVRSRSRSQTPRGNSTDRVSRKDTSPQEKHTQDKHTQDKHTSRWGGPSNFPW